MNIKKLNIFIIIVFLLNYLLAGFFYLVGGKWYTPISVTLGVIYMFIPFIGVIIVEKIIYKQQIIKPLGVSLKFNKWFIFAWFLPVIIAISTLGISSLFPGIEYSSNMDGFFERFKDVITEDKLIEMKQRMFSLSIHPFWIGIFQGLIAGISINAFIAFGEEIAWRGFLFNELNYLGFWKSSILIGFIWGIWHAPIILQGHNYPQHPIIGVFMMIVFCILLSPIMSYIRTKSNSVIACSIFHGTLNATSGLSIILLKGGNDIITGVTGLSGFTALTVINLLIYIYQNKT